MNTVLEVLTTMVMITYYWVEAIVLFFVPVSFRKKNVAGEKVLITGAGSGLGRGMSVKFAELGCHVVLWDINQSGNEETAQMCRELGAKVNTYTCDLAKREAIYAASEKVKQEVGDIDILVNNAGIVTGRKLLDCPDQLMEATMNINCNAHFWTLKSFLPSMIARNHGHVVTIASMAGIAGMNGLVDYCASKFAAVGLNEALASEMHATGKTGVHVTLVCPTYISTGMFNGVHVKWQWLCPMLEPDWCVSKIIEAVLINQPILMLPRSSYTTIITKSILPWKACTYLFEQAGFSSSMDHFHGHAKAN